MESRKQMHATNNSILFHARRQVYLIVLLLGATFFIIINFKIIL